MFSLSVCLIVKNEEKVLARCLNCAKQFADEIIVVDTGSTDKTKAIARVFTKNVYDFPWINDFSKARNFSFEKATKDYIMWLDADDVVSKENVEKINNLKKSSCPADIYFFKYEIAFDESGNPTFSYFRERIVKRELNFKWEGFVHEAIVPRGKIERINISIEHRKISQNPPKRNLLIYEEKLKQGVLFSPREQFYYARELFFNNKIKKCISVLKKYLKNENLFLANKIDAHVILAKCYSIENEKENAKEILYKSFSFAPPNAEICCLLGELEAQTNLENAKFWFETALICKKNYESGAFVEEGFYGLIPCLNLCLINYKQGNLEKAKEFHEKSKVFSPKNPSVLFNEEFFKKLKN